MFPIPGIIPYNRVETEREIWWEYIEYRHV